MKRIYHLVSGIFVLILSAYSNKTFAAETTQDTTHQIIDLTSSNIGLASIFIFIIAYILVMTEEFTQLRKSKPVIIAAGIIWAMIGYVYMHHGMSELAEHAVRHNFLEYTELMLFLLVAMAYINSMEERQVFDALRSWLIRKGFSFRQFFWLFLLINKCWRKSNKY